MWATFGFWPHRVMSRLWALSYLAICSDFLVFGEVD